MFVHRFGQGFKRQELNIAINGEHNILTLLWRADTFDAFNDIAQAIFLIRGANHVYPLAGARRQARCLLALCHPDQ